jgi:hypothetical protein
VTRSTGDASSSWACRRRRQAPPHARGGEPASEADRGRPGARSALATSRRPRTCGEKRGDGGPAAGHRRPCAGRRRGEPAPRLPLAGRAPQPRALRAAAREVPGARALECHPRGLAPRPDSPAAVAVRR